MLNPSPEQILPRLFWPVLALALLSALASQGLPALRPEAFTVPYPRNPWMLSAVHLAALGWLGTLFLAVTAQAGPVLLHRSQGRPGSAWAGPWLFHLGALGLVAFFAGLRSFGCLLPALGVLALGLGLALGRFASLAQGERPKTRAWSPLASAFAYLAALWLLGSLMGVGLLKACLPQALAVNLEFHLHLALLGFAGFAILGLLPKLLRLFLGALRYPAWPGTWAGRAAHAGLALQALAWLGGGRVCSIGAALLCCAAALGLLLQVLLQARAATRPVWTSSFTLQLLGLLWLACAGVCDVPRALRGLSYSGDAALLYLALFGGVGGVILGTVQRISAVLAWFQRFWEANPEHTVPTAWSLVHPRLAWGAVGLHALAVPCGVLGLDLGRPGLIRLAGCAGSGAVAASMALAALALRRGKKEPLAP